MSYGVTKETRVNTLEDSLPIGSIVGRDGMLYTRDVATGHVEKGRFEGVCQIDEHAEIVEVRLADCSSIRCTPSQNILTIFGWRPACELSSSDKAVSLNGDIPVIGVTKFPYKVEIFSMSVPEYGSFSVGRSGVIVRC